MTEINDMLNFDPLSVAEKLTGNSYKSDSMTAEIGFALHLLHGQNVREEMGLRDDTYHNCSFDDTVRIYLEEGFSIIHSHTFTSDNYWGEEPVQERYFILYSETDNIIAVVESYRGTNTNSTKFYYNWDPHEGVKYHHYTSSGHMVRDESSRVWVGYHDGREALRHKLAQLRSAGTFCKPWLEPQRLWLLDYSEVRSLEGRESAERFDGYDKISSQRFRSLPQHVQVALAGELPD